MSSSYIVLGYITRNFLGISSVWYGEVSVANRRITQTTIKQAIYFCWITWVILPFSLYVCKVSHQQLVMMTGIAVKRSILFIMATAVSCKETYNFPIDRFLLIFNKLP